MTQKNNDQPKTLSVDDFVPTPGPVPIDPRPTVLVDAAKHQRALGRSKNTVTIDAFIRGAWEAALLCGRVHPDDYEILQTLVNAGRHIEALTYLEKRIARSGAEPALAERMEASGRFGDTE